MGRFSNIQYNDTVNSLMNTMKHAVNNPYYMYTDKPPTPVTYYHLDTNLSTLDSGSEIAQNDVGPDSPFWYKRISNMMIYGIDSPISVSLSNEDFGLESDAITGTGFLLPDTIIPNPNDFFVIDYTTKKIVFKINSINPDTLENGKNIYQFEYRSSTVTQEDLNKQVSQDYKLIISNSGTELNTIIKSEVIDWLELLDSTSTNLKQFFINIFYKSRVQTFVYKYAENYFYDPCMIEFLIKNNILDNTEDGYVYIAHQTPLQALFPFMYKSSFFHCLEIKDIDYLYQYKTVGYGKLITHPLSILSTRLEDYYEINYDIPEGMHYVNELPTFRDELFEHIKNNVLYTEKYTYYNIIIKFLNNQELTFDDLKSLDNLDFENNIYLFYAIPCIIYCIESVIKQELSKSDIQ